MKICKDCKIEKETSEFNKDKNSKDGFYTICGLCRGIRDKKYSAKARIRHAKWAIENPEKNKTTQKKYRDAHKKEFAQYYIDNKSSLSNYMKEYRKIHKNEIAERKQEYYKKNKGNYCIYSVKYRKNNKSKLKREKADYYQRTKVRDREKKNNRYNKQYYSDISFRLSVCLRSRLRQALKKNSKGGSAVKDLGCSVEYLKKYLESKFHSGMDWNNHGNTHNTWQIDHIRPLCSFDLTKREELLKACHYTNLQPIWNKDHIDKTSIDIKNKYIYSM